MTPSRAGGWPAALTAATALLYGWVGVAGSGQDLVWGVGGGLLVLLALVVGRRSTPVGAALLVVGAVPLAVATWWSVVTPVVALLTLVLGALALRACRGAGAAAAGTNVPVRPS